MMNPRVQQLAGRGAFAVCLGIVAVYALLAFISTPRGAGGIDSAHAAIVYIGVGMVVLALIAVHVVLGRQLLAAARQSALAAAAAGHTAGAIEGHEAHGGGDHHNAHHPTALTYVIVGAILTLITAVEVSAYYIPAWSGSAIYVPSMLLLSAVKFVTVVMFYMHLKYDHKLFRALFTGPFLIAFATLFGLMFLFGKLAIRLGILS